MSDKDCIINIQGVRFGTGPTLYFASNKPPGDDREKHEDSQHENGEAQKDESKQDEPKQDSQEKKDKQPEDDKNKDRKKPKPRWPIVVLIVVVFLLIIVAVIYWLETRNEESTDDAYTEGNAVAIAAKVSGYVVERRVDDNTIVHAGDLMVQINPVDYVTARDQARANLDLARAQLLGAEIDLKIAKVRYPSDRQQSLAQLKQATANLRNAKREYERQKTVDQRATAQTTVDQATAQFDSNEASAEQAEAQLKVSSLVKENIGSTNSTLKQRQAQVAQGEASLAQAELNLGYTEMRAPQDGRVTRRNVDVGTYAQVGQQLFYVVSPLTWVVANFKETQLDRMHEGQHVTIKVDSHPHMLLHGHVESIQQGSGARFTTFPAENATGNFVKIVRRVPVKIVIDDGIDPKQGLPLGLSVVPTVDVQ